MKLKPFEFVGSAAVFAETATGEFCCVLKTSRQTVPTGMRWFKRSIKHRARIRIEWRYACEVVR